MTCDNVRTSAVGRLAAVLLLWLLAAPFTAPYSTIGSGLSTTVSLNEGAGSERAVLKALAQPFAAPIVETWAPAAVSRSPRVLPIPVTRAHRVLRL